MKNKTNLFSNTLIGFFLFILFSCNTIKKTESVLCYDIIFGDYFSDDIIDLYIDNSLVIKDGKLNSAGSNGVTKIYLKIIYEGSNYFISINGDKTIIDLKKDSNLFKLIINGKEKTFKINRNKGNYLLFFGDKKNVVDFFQSKQPIELD